MANPRIFISSTSIDLPKYREAAIHACQRVGLSPLYMEEWLPDPRDAVRFCMGQVDEADFYLGILAHRYGYLPEGSDVSITEMEYRHAIERGLPVYMFIVDPEYPWPPNQIDRGIGYERLEKFKNQIARSHMLRKFRDAQGFKEDLLLLLPTLTSKPLQDSGRGTNRPVIPAPPELHSVPPYILTTSFIGREKELAELDGWGHSADPIMVLDAIGGMGKSALAWEWTRKRARHVMPDLAGIVWWSFYETGSTMSSLTAEVLAYAMLMDPAEARAISPGDRTRMLLTELRRRKYLLVLDGFERVLAAYHRLDPSKLRDEQVESDLRACTNLRDSVLLRELVTCSPSKILISTRLMPRSLENAAHQPIPGVRRKNLSGLAADDGLALLRRLGIRGEPGAIKKFLQQFGNHGLLITILAGRILDFRPSPGNFDLWLNDPREGGGLRLGHLDLKERRTHILEYAFQGLEPEKRSLLSRIAAFSDAVNYGTLSILNPYITPPPEVKEPKFVEPVWGQISLEEQALRQEKLEEEFREKKSTYEAYRAYFESPEYRAGIAEFDRSLVDLESRGLLQWDRQLDSYDLHPVVRAYAFDQLEELDRLQTYERIRDHFERLPPERTDEAVDLSQLKNTIQIYRAFIGGGHAERAANLYVNSLSGPLLYSIASYSTIIELLSPFFFHGLDLPPLVSASNRKAFILGDIGMAFSLSGQHEKALISKRTVIGLAIDLQSWKELATYMRNYAVDLRATNRLFSSVSILELARDLSVAINDRDGLRMAHFHLAAIHTYLGQPEIVQQELAAFGRDEFLSKRTYRPGGAERYACWSKFFKGTLTVDEASAALAIAIREKSSEVERSMYHLLAELALQQGHAEKAIELAEQALTLANKSGTPISEYQGCLARAQFAQGLREEALASIQEALEADHEGVLSRPYCDAAEIYLKCRDRENAKKYASLAYRQAWSDGPPYVWWWWLKRSKVVLEALGSVEPQLPALNPGRVESISREADIRRIIEKFEEENRQALEARLQKKEKKADKKGTSNWLLKLLNRL